jgi:alkenylglycerophosphocholine/alkenylglycerophosphoethanolamine hydrolase
MHCRKVSTLIGQSGPKYPIGLAVVALVAVVGFFVGLWMDVLWLRLLLKPIPVLVLIIWVLSWKRTRDAKAIVLGLGLSIVGDILLEVPAKLFIWGLVAFLLAHVCYIVAFVSRSKRLAPLWACGFLLWCGGMFVWMSPGLGKLAIPVAVYVMGPGGKAAKIVLAGAVFFAFSDSCIAVNKFISSFEGAREIIIATYWLGQWGIAWSVGAAQDEDVV